jgi:hypothetical protein
LLKIINNVHILQNPFMYYLNMKLLIYLFYTILCQNTNIYDQTTNESLNTTAETDIIDLNQRDIELEQETQYEKEILTDIKYINETKKEDPKLSKLQKEWEDKISEFDAAEIITLEILKGHTEVNLY